MLPAPETMKHLLLLMLTLALTAGGMFAAKEYEASAKDVMFNVQSQIILELAKKSSCIIVGRCSNYVLE